MHPVDLVRNGNVVAVREHLVARGRRTFDLGQPGFAPLPALHVANGQPNCDPDQGGEPKRARDPTVAGLVAVAVAVWPF